MKKTAFYGMMIAAMGFMASCGNNENDSKDAAEDANEQKMDNADNHKMEGDADFAVKAADGGMLEVELGKLALTNAASADVKTFGQQMVDDHSKGNEELKALAAQKNITLPATVSQDHQDKINDLSKKTGADFDKAYMSLMVDDHNEDIDEFQKEADNGNDADIKGWAAGKIPVLQHHLDMAKTTKDALK